MTEDLDGVLIKHKQDYADDSDDDFLSNGGEIKIIGAGAKGIYQNASITRKFWSKAAPEIPIEDYLFRFVFPSFDFHQKIGVFFETQNLISSRSAKKTPNS